MSIDQSIIERLKGQHGRELHVIECEGREVIVKPVSRAAYSIFKEMAVDPDRKAKAGDELFYSVCVYPEGEQLEKMIDERPFLLTHFSGKVIELAGASEKATAKKL